MERTNKANVMKKQGILYLVCAAAVLCSCNIYRQYHRPDVETGGLYRDTVSAAAALPAQDTANMGNLPWRQVFTDPHLQALIGRALVNNANLQTAYLRVKEAEAGLLSARLAYTPSLALAPQGQVSSFDKSAGSWTYTLPVSASWEVDLFGRLLNAKRGARAALLQSEAYRQAVVTQIIAAVANTYYTLLMLDKQLEITERTAGIWQKTVSTMRAMKEAGMGNEAAIVQSEANSYMIAASIPELKRQIRETENAMSLLLYEAPQAIERGKLEDQVLPAEMKAGVPVQMLAGRPDVQAAEMALAGAFYMTNQARSAFYPSLSLSGIFGWTNSAGTAVLNPGRMIAQAVGSVVAPVFNRGANTARLRVAKAQQQEAMIAFRQALLNAGSEVSNALYQYKTAQDKIEQREKQIASLEKSVDYTRELLSLGGATYLEVLTAQQGLLNAQISGIADEFQRMQSVVNLYQALGGGRGDRTLPAAAQQN